MGTLGNVKQFKDTRKATAQGWYPGPAGQVGFLQSAEQHATALYFDEATVLVLASSLEGFERRFAGCRISVVNADSFSAAIAMPGAFGVPGTPPLVLNFASAHRPGGGVETGATAQEEDLCRCSTLYVSITSEVASAFYRDNRSADKSLYSHAMVVSPYVEVFKNSGGEALPAPVPVAVVTAPAPNAKRYRGAAGSLEDVLRVRIRGLLAVAARCGYDKLVLGAWGCGVFGNDPRVIAGLFAQELWRCTAQPVSPGGAPALFSHVCFAVLDHSRNQSTYQAFADRFTAGM